MLVISVLMFAGYFDNSALISYSLAVVAVVFICCALIELARIYIFEKHYMDAVNKAACHVDFGRF